LPFGYNVLLVDIWELKRERLQPFFFLLWPVVSHLGNVLSEKKEVFFHLIHPLSQCRPYLSFLIPAIARKNHLKQLGTCHYFPINKESALSLYRKCVDYGNYTTGNNCLVAAFYSGTEHYKQKQIG
jgi:hypothetical protein